MLGEDGLYKVAGAGAGTTVRIIRTSPDQILGEAGTPVRSPAMSFEVRASEVVAPASGDTCLIDGATYKVRSAHRPDSFRLTWLCEAVPA